MVIFANGQGQGTADYAHIAARMDADDVVCCADGGVNHALAMGLKPAVIIGDCDSIAPELAEQLQAQGIAFERAPKNKDETDLQLALDWALAQGAGEVMLVTATGGRLDLLLANVLLMCRPAYQYTHVTLVDGAQWACVLHAHDAFELHGTVGDGLSLLPLSPTVESVCLKGTQWPLKNETLQFGDSRAVSNVFVKPKIKLEIGDGMLLVIHTCQEDITL